jgi:hypothetical protein
VLDGWCVVRWEMGQDGVPSFGNGLKRVFLFRAVLDDMWSVVSKVLNFLQIYWGLLYLFVFAVFTLNFILSQSPTQPRATQRLDGNPFNLEACTEHSSGAQLAALYLHELFNRPGGGGHEAR